MIKHPKRADYASDGDFLDAMADHYGIDRRMVRHIPIPKMIHDDDTCPHLVVLGRLEAENASLKAEVERLTKAGDELERVLTSKMSSYEVGNASFQWRTAKEGKPHA